VSAAVFTLVFAVVITGIGWSAVPRLDPSERLSGVERAAAAFLAGCFVIYYGVFAIGTFRLDWVTMWGLALACVVASLPGLRRIPWRAVAGGAQAEFRAAAADPWIAVLWAAVILVAISSMVQGLAPPNDYDSLMYHLALPQYDIERGRIEIAWDRNLAHALFPAMTSNLSRFALATMDASTAQMLHGLLGLIAALGAGLLATRTGCGRATALLAALFFLSLRTVIWQMASVEVDVPLAAFTSMALIVYLAWRKKGGVGLGTLFGLLIGGGILVKYIGFLGAFAFAPLLIYDFIIRRKAPLEGMIAPVIALVAITPHMVRNFWLTGNPIYSLFNSFFNPGKPNPLASLRGAFVSGYGIDELLITPWKMFVAPMQYFDGMILGAPFILALAPLILLNPGRARRWLPTLTVVLGIYVLWFYALGHQVRFLLFAFPMLAVVAATGAAEMWRAVVKRALLRTGFVAIGVVFAVNQGIFVGIYGALRLPVAVGFMSPATYHAETPTLNGAFYKTCSYIRQNLKPGERYFSLLQPHSFYCPQASVTHVFFTDEAKWWLDNVTPPKMSRREFLSRTEKARFKYFIIPTANENRRNVTAAHMIKRVDLAALRFGEYLKPVMAKLDPIIEGSFTAVYDGRKVIDLLKTGAGGG
jgi:hypothetical protein